MLFVQKKVFVKICLPNDTVNALTFPKGTAYYTYWVNTKAHDCPEVHSESAYKDRLKKLALLQCNTDGK